MADAPDGVPHEVVAVGGTVSNLIKVVAFGVAEGILTRAGNARALALLGAEPSELAARRHGIKPIRARMLPAGAVIVEAVMDRYGAEQMRVLDAGIREGAILAAAHAGHAWRDRTPGTRPRLARVSQTQPATTRPSARRKPIPATPRHGPPIVRFSRATSRSRLTR